MAFIILQGDANHIPLRDESVQCVVTSPPYWGLRAYLPDADPLKRHELGLEPVHDCLGWATGNPCGECYVCHMVAVFREVKRVLRPDGSVFLNLGDSYAASSKGDSRSTQDLMATSTLTGSISYGAEAHRQERRSFRLASAGLKPKDLVGIPWRVAFALQADGWYLRSAIIWAKGISFCDTYSGSVMPESVTDRPTKAHEDIFLLTKSARYFYDNEAVKEAAVGKYDPDFVPNKRDWRTAGWPTDASGKAQRTGNPVQATNPQAPASGRNLRDVWAISPTPYKAAHFATFSPSLVEPMIKAGSSERGACPRCGAPWERVVEKESRPNWQGNGQKHDGTYYRPNPGGGVANDRRITSFLGWRPTCSCNAGDPVPCVVLDPFSGAGTTVLVADRLGRNGVGLDLSGTYTRMGRDRVFNDAPLLALMGV